MGKDYYSILGVDKKGCDEAALKKAYRKLAMQTHPVRIWSGLVTSPGTIQMQPVINCCEQTDMMPTHAVLRVSGQEC